MKTFFTIIGFPLRLLVAVLLSVGIVLCLMMGDVGDNDDDIVKSWKRLWVWAICNDMESQ